MARAGMCYVLLPSKGYTVGVVKWGECGYYETNYPNGFTQEMVDDMNTRLGVDKKVAECMVICSMNNFSTTELWEKHFEMIMEMKGNKRNESV